ncbi:hypothetical protein LSCM4_05372 [Leishmania orientalis]|uniref:Uncharacterized protein n=1 Tax=Leishmania orientalis TaxID=2249476 RepID=A0A836GMR0_9TRYP|nr:hypothetical protein LSCM4_05372 [Leishmania orientalis]
MVPNLSIKAFIDSSIITSHLLAPHLFFPRAASNESTCNPPAETHQGTPSHTRIVQTHLFPIGANSGMRAAPTCLGRSTAASLRRYPCGSRACNADGASWAGWRRCRRAAGVTTATVDVTAIPVSSTSLCASRRAYYWPYPENLVPEGETTSPFQSSPVPSVRERIVREYALGPLFGSRTPSCVLGFAGSARDVLGRKGDVRRCVARILGKAELEVELGALLQAREMLLHRSGTDESPRLADGAGSRPDAERRRVTRYARLPVQARTLLEVYLPGEEQGGAGVSADADATILAHGYFLQEQLYRYMNAAASSASEASDREGIHGNEHEEAGGKMQPSSQEDRQRDDEADLRASVAALHDTCGVVYCEVPALDESDFVFEQLNGKRVDSEMLDRVMGRWERRVAQQQQQQL